MKQFVSVSLGAVVSESMCECGHLERDHGSVLHPLGGGSAFREAHGGGCCCGECRCNKFTWARHVTAHELAEIEAAACMV